MEKKSKREANFTKSEIDIFIDIVLKYQNIIENKRTDATTWKDKNEAWERIAHELNTTTGNFPRSVKTIRAKYESVKKNIRKKCALIRTKRQKADSGPCLATFTANEEKILSLSPSMMVGLQGRFDTDIAQADLPSESGHSEMQQCNPTQHIEEDPKILPMSEEIEIVDDKDDDLLQFLKMSANTEFSKISSDNPEKPAKMSKNVKKEGMGAAERENDLHKDEARECHAKFPFANKRIKPTKKSRFLEENLKLKNEILQLQKQLLMQEVESKSEISKLMVENLELDNEIKRLNLQKLEANIANDDSDL